MLPHGEYIRGIELDNQNRELQIIAARKLQAKKRRENRLVVGLLVFTGFFLGFVAGMLIVHGKSTKDIAAVQAELDRVIEEQSAINVTNVYIPERKIDSGKIAMNSYKTENFRLDNGFMAYFDDDGNKISHLGVDLSYHNETINWQELAASGCEFAMIRIGYRGYTEGGLVKDEKFEEYFEGARGAGINVGVYFLTQAITVEEARQEAEYVIELLDGRELQYPVAYDTEYINDEKARTNTTDISDELRSQMCIAFCERILQEGYYPMIYAAENWMRRNMDLKALTDYEFWAPQYLDENDFLYDFSIWQYTEEGSIPGVKTLVDLDISMVDYASFVPKLREAYLTGGVIQTNASKGELVITTRSSDDPFEEKQTPETNENLEDDLDSEGGMGNRDLEAEENGESPTISITN